MTYRQQFIRSVAETCGLRVVNDNTLTLADIERELALVRSELEPLERAESALLALREDLQ